MQKIIQPLRLMQKTLMSRSLEAHEYEIVLCNQKPLTHTHTTATSIVRYDKDKNNEMYQLSEFKDIRNSNSRTLRPSETHYIVINRNPVLPNIPFFIEQINSKEIHVIDTIKWFAETDDADAKDPGQPGAKLGRLDAANEAGFFHRTDRSKLREIKKKLKSKPDLKPAEPKPGAKP